MPVPAEGAPSPGGSQAGEEYDLPTAYEAVPKEHLVKHMLMHASTEEKDGNFVFPDVKRTPPKKIGKITNSVGIQLYFELMQGLGWTFFVMFLLSVPLLICNVSGSMVESTSALNQALASTTIANLGSCPTGGCQSAEDFKDRCLWDGDCDDEGALLREWTPYLGGLDALCLLVFMLFGVIFRNFRIPAVARQFDLDSVTPADFTLDIPNPPRELQADHHNYEARLRAHFVNVLKNLRENAYADADDSCVPEISLVREYNGATSKFLDKGRHIENLRNSHMAKLKVESTVTDEAKKAKLVAKHNKAVEKHQKKVDGLSKTLKSEAAKIEHERQVCRAFVTFKTIEMKEKVEWEYRFSQYGLLRLCQREQLRFEGKRIKVQQAPEPSDLYWENLDFNPYKQMARKCCILVTTIVLLLLTSFALVGAQSFFKSASSVEPQYVGYVLQSVPEMQGAAMKRSNLCFRVESMTLMEKCVGQTSTSDTWGYDEVFDAYGTIHESTTKPHHTGSHFWDNHDWASPGCNETLNGPVTVAPTKEMQWTAIVFDQFREVQCMQLEMGSADYASRVRLWACVEDALPDEQFRYNWTPSAGCHAMQVSEVSAPGETPKLKIMRDTECALEIKIDVAEEAKRKGFDQQVDCFCKQEAIRNPQVTAPPYNTREKMLCEDWSVRQIKMYSAMIFGIVAVLIINQLLLLVFSFFVAFMRPTSVTEKTTSELVMLFFAQFVNTALLTYLVSSRMPSIPDALKFITEPLSIGKGEYYEVTASWYTVIGVSLTITIVTQVFSNTLPQLATSCLVAPALRKFSIWWGGAVTRTQLEAIWMLPEWNLALRTAQSFNVVCTIIFYSGGMPVLYFAGAFYTFVSYWLDKYGLLKGSRRPPAYDTKVIETCMHFIPMSAVLHAVFASFVFGNQELFPSDWNTWLRPFAEFIFGVSFDESERVVDEWAVASKNDRDNAELFKLYMQARWLDFARWGSSALLVIFVVGFVYYVLFYLWYLILAPILQPITSALREFFRVKCCPRLCAHRKNLEEVGEEWKVAQKDFLKRGLVHTYHMRDHPMYSAAALAVEHTARKELERRGTTPASSPASNKTVSDAASPASLKAATAPAAVGSPASPSTGEDKV